MDEQVKLVGGGVQGRSGESRGAAVGDAATSAGPGQERVSAAVARSGETLARVLRERAEHDGERDGFVFLTYRGAGTPAEERLAYGELLGRAQAIAATLQAGGTRGDRVLILCPPGLDYIAAFFACQLAAMVAVPAYPPRNAKHMGRLQAILADAGAAAILVPAGFSGRLTDWAGGRDRLPRLVAIDAIGPEVAASWRDPNPHADDLAFLQYTSGTTGHPKGVMVSHAQAIDNLNQVAAITGLGREDIGCFWLPPYHDMGLVNGVLGVVFIGYSNVLMAPASFLRRPACWLEAITGYQGTYTAAPNFAYQLCADEISQEEAAKFDLSFLRLAVSGAETVRFATLGAFAAKFARAGFEYRRFAAGYGMAETVLLTAGQVSASGPKVRTVDEEEPAAHHPTIEGHFDGRNLPPAGERRRTAVSCGPVIPGHDARIVDPETRRPLTDGAVGEIWVSGPSVAAGYWNKPDESKATFAARLAEDPGGRPYLRTGDLGSLIDGELYVLGRLKELLIIRGRNHYPQDIEATAAEAHAVLKRDRAAAFAVEVSAEGIVHPGGESASNVREEGLVLVQELDRTALRRLDGGAVCAAIRRAILQQQEIDPQAIVLIKPASLPRTTSGKIQRQRARDMFFSGELAEVARWERSAQTPQAQSGTAASVGAQSLADRLAAMSPEKRQSHLIHLVQTELAGVLGLAGPDQVPTEQPIQELGLDSLMAVELGNRISERIGGRVSAGVVLGGESAIGVATAALAAISHRLAPLSTPAIPEELGLESPELEVQVPDGAMAAEEQDRRLHPAQYFFWYGRRLGLADNLGGRLALDANLNAVRLTRCVRAVLNGNPRLLIAIDPDAPRFTNSVGEDTPVIEVVDTSRLSAGELSLRFARFVSRPFALSAPPLLRLALVSTGERACQLWFAAAHIVLDATSMVVFLEQVAATYKTGSPPQPSPPAPMPPQPTQRSMDFWQAYLGSAPTPRLEHRLLRAGCRRLEPAPHFTVPCSLVDSFFDSVPSARGLRYLEACILDAYQQVTGVHDLVLGLQRQGRESLTHAEALDVQNAYVMLVVRGCRPTIDGTMRVLENEIQRINPHRDVPAVLMGRYWAALGCPRPWRAAVRFLMTVWFRDEKPHVDRLLAQACKETIAGALFQRLRPKHLSNGNLEINLLPSVLGSSQVGDFGLRATPMQDELPFTPREHQVCAVVGRLPNGDLDLGIVSMLRRSVLEQMVVRLVENLEDAVRRASTSSFPKT